MNMNYNYNGKENRSLILNISKKDENIQNNNNSIKKKINQIKDNIKPIIYKKNLSNSNKYINNKIGHPKNPIAEYDDSIMKNIFLHEVKNRANYKQCKQMLNEKDILTRYNSINFIISMSETFELRQETIYLAINLFDRCFTKFKSLHNSMNIKLFVLSCIFIATKYEEIYPPLIEDYQQFFYFPKQDLFKLENFILDVVNFELHICSPYLFLTKFFYSNSKIESNEILFLAQLILDLSTISLEFCSFKPSFQAVICLYLSRYILYKNKSGYKIWTIENEFDTGYSEIEIKKNIKISLKMIQQFYKGGLVKDITKTAIFRKYSENKYSCVAKKIREQFNFI